VVETCIAEYNIINKKQIFALTEKQDSTYIQMQYDANIKNKNSFALSGIETGAYSLYALRIKGLFFESKMIRPLF
jgi:hypothetical protein